MIQQQTLQAFHNDPLQKEKYVSIIQKAYDENKLQSGKYWCESDCTGCLVGQITKDVEGKHDRFAKDLNTPEWISYLFDTVFEGLPAGKREQWALDVIKVIPVGFSNWQSLYHKLCIFNLEEICKNTDHPIVKQAIADIISLHKLEETYKQIWYAAEYAAESAAWSAARSAGSSARSAAWSAARSAGSSARSVTKHIWSATESAARSAGSSARSAATSAAWSAAWSIAWYAESAAYVKISERIIELFGEVSF